MLWCECAPLRGEIEVAESLYHLRSAASRRSPRREDLNALRKDTKSLRSAVLAAAPTSRPGARDDYCGRQQTGDTDLFLIA